MNNEKKFKKGDKIRVKGKIETVIGYNSNGNIETEENDYSHNPTSQKIEKVHVHNGDDKLVTYKEKETDKPEQNISINVMEKELKDAGFFIGGLTDDQIKYYYQKNIVDKKIDESKLRSVTVHFNDGDVVHTSMAAHLTDKEIKEYYAIGKMFTNSKEKQHKVTSVTINH